MRFWSRDEYCGWPVLCRQASFPWIWNVSVSLRLSGVFHTVVNHWLSLCGGVSVDTCNMRTMSSPKLSFFCSWFLYINKNPFNYKVLEKFRQHWSHLSPSYHCLKTFECTLHLDACISISQILPLCFTYGHSLQTNFFSQMMKTDIVYMSIKSQLCTIQWENFE